MGGRGNAADGDDIAVDFLGGDACSSAAAAIWVFMSLMVSMKDDGFQRLAAHRLIDAVPAAFACSIADTAWFAPVWRRSIIP